MPRLIVTLALLALFAASAAPAKQNPRQADLQRYLVKIGPEIRSYRSIAERIDDLFAQPPMANVDPFVEKLYRVADRLVRLAGRWNAIGAPKGLRVRHRGMGRVFELQAEASRITAAAFFTRHPDEIAAAAERIAPLFNSAAYLQKRWAAALLGALVRAQMKVPKWLNQIVKNVP